MIETFKKFLRSRKLELNMGKSKVLVFNIEETTRKRKIGNGGAKG